MSCHVMKPSSRMPTGFHINALALRNEIIKGTTVRGFCLATERRNEKHSKSIAEHAQLTSPCIMNDTCASCNHGPCLIDRRAAFSLFHVLPSCCQCEREVPHVARRALQALVPRPPSGSCSGTRKTRRTNQRCHIPCQRSCVVPCRLVLVVSNVPDPRFCAPPPSSWRAKAKTQTREKMKDDIAKMAI